MTTFHLTFYHLSVFPRKNIKQEQMFSTLIRSAFDFKRRCTECSVYDIKVPSELFESIETICSVCRSRGTLISYTDHSVQRRLKSNAPNNTKCFVSSNLNNF